MKLIKKLQKLRNKVELAKQSADRELFWQSIARQVTPATIEELPEYVLIDRKLMARCIIVGVPPSSDISGYPSDLNQKVIDELLGISAEGHCLALSYLVKPIPNVEAMKMLDEALFHNRVSQDSYRDRTPGTLGQHDKTRQPPLKKVFEEGEFTQNYKELFENKQKMFHTAFIVVLWGKDRETLRQAESHVTIVLESNRIYYEIPDFRHLDTLIAAQPYPQWVDYSWIELFSYHTAALLPTRNPNSRTDETGLYFGDDLRTGKNIQIDLKSLAAQHLMFVGPTGSGKTFTLLMLLMRAYDMLGKRIIYTTPKADVTTNYRAVAEYYGARASIIDIGPRGRNINPLQVFCDENVMFDAISCQRAFDEHMEILDQFFAVLFQDTKTPNQTSYLNESLMEVYRRKGIYRSDPESWKNKEFPTLLDLREIWVEDAKQKDVTAQAFVDKTFMITTAWSYMNRPTDINLSADFIIIDISDVPASLQDAMNVFVTGIMAQRFRTDAKKETIIAVDEAAVFLRNPKLSLFLLRTLTQGRSYNISLWLATQQTGDLVKAGVDEEFKTNMQISIVLGNMRRDTVEHVKAFYKLDEHSTQDLMTCGVGEGLLIVGSEVIPTGFRPTDHEYAVIKGKHRGTIASENAADESLLLVVHPGIKDLISEHQIYFPDWLQPGQDISLLSKEGYKQFRAQKLDGSPGFVWLPQRNVTGSMVWNQSIDHYSTVLQLAGWFILHGIPIVQINHNDGADLVIDIKGKRIAIEYERPGSHSFKELVEKKETIENSGAEPLFICQQGNLEDVIRAVGDKNVVQRGSELISELEELKQLNERKMDS
jgi:hypothetical protein